MDSRRKFLTMIVAGAASTALPAFGQQAPKGWKLPAAFTPKNVRISGNRPAGEIHVLPNQRYLLWTLPEGRAIRYVVAIGSDQQYRSGDFTVARKAEWPSWTPTRNMIRRFPDKYAQYAGGVVGGPDNPLGARALYLSRPNGSDSLLRIHGTPHPWTIGQAASNGCVRMTNDHVSDLYEGVEAGAKVILHER